MLALPAIFLSTDRSLVDPTWTLAQSVSNAIKGGTCAVIFRESDLPTKARQTVFDFFRKAVPDDVLLLISDPDISFDLSQVSGIHCDFSGGPIEVKSAGFLRGKTLTSLSDAGDTAQNWDYFTIYLDWNDPVSAIETVKKFTAVSNRPLIVGKDPPLSLIASLFNVGISGIELTFAACGAYNKTEAVAEYQKQISEYFYQTSGVNHGDAKR